MNEGENRTGAFARGSRSLPAWDRLTVWTIYALAVVGSVLYCQAKLQALQFHQTDFSFYMEFAVRVTDPQMGRYYSHAPAGNNILGILDLDGASGLHRTIHLEPVKYLYVLLYWLIPSPLPIFAVLALLYYSPVLYWVSTQPGEDRGEKVFAVLLSLGYVLHQSLSMPVSHDIRPFLLTGPALAFFVMAVVRDRPRREIVATYLLVFFVREEAIVWGLIGIAFLAAWKRAKGEDPRPVIRTLLICYGVYVVAAGVYYALAGYRLGRASWVYGSLFHVVRRFWPQLLVLGALAAPAGWFVTRTPEGRRRALAMLTYSLYVLPVALPMLAIHENAGALLKGYLFHPRWAMVNTFLLLAALPVWQVATSRSFRKGAMGFLVGCVVFFVLAALQPGAKWREVLDYPRQAREAAIVLSYRDGVDPKTTAVLCSPRAFQAFYRFDEVFYPGEVPPYVRWNPDLLGNMTPDGYIAKTVDIVVTSREELGQVRPTISDWSDREMRLLRGNESYEIYSLAEEGTGMGNPVSPN